MDRQADMQLPQASNPPARSPTQSRSPRHAVALHVQRSDECPPASADRGAGLRSPLNSSTQSPPPATARRGPSSSQSDGKQGKASHPRQVCASQRQLRGALRTHRRRLATSGTTVRIHATWQRNMRRDVMLGMTTDTPRTPGQQTGNSRRKSISNLAHNDKTSTSSHLFQVWIGDRQAP